MNRFKWYLIKLTNGKHMVVWCVKDEEEAIIIAKSCIIRRDLDFDFELESIVEIKGWHDSKLVGIKDIIDANNA